MSKHFGVMGMALVTVLTVQGFAVPQQINYQGQLTGISGAPMDTTVAMTFRLYADSTGGFLLWTEARPSVSVAGGLFSVRLGQLTALSDAIVNQAQLWLGITIGTDSEMAPRTRIVSSAYSYRVGTVDGSSGGTISGDVNVVGKGNIGSSNSNEGAFAFVSGRNNHARGNYSVVSGGGGTAAHDSNSALGNNSTVSGGSKNSTPGGRATVGGGYLNNAANYCATVSGGEANDATSSYATVSGGEANDATGSHATAGGGRTNGASGDYSVVAGGNSNAATASSTTVGGGSFNDATESSATVAGGNNNISSGPLATIGGGRFNRARGEYAVVAGGGGTLQPDSNYASDYASVGGGAGNWATSWASTISGGSRNITGGSWATVGGGRFNRARGGYAVVAGGGSGSEADSNSATGTQSVIGGGTRNRVSGARSVIAGGGDNSCSGIGTFVCGNNVDMVGDSSFIFSDGRYNGVSGTGGDRRFVVITSNGSSVYSSANLSSGVTLGAGASSWVSVSDSTRKRYIEPADTKTALKQLAALPIRSWEYKSEPDAIRHLGPMAQDFWNSFHLGSDSLGIATIDADGVLFAAVQELAKENAELKVRLQRLETQFQSCTAANQKALQEVK